ncbi:hypothetical protein MBRA_27980 [Mycobacterium branderi]|uniref:WXG100 family type VII secretion target n=1 Tax=Mycobacterium branderi TaxID=43348 RepID=A0ABN6B7K5_9MYCO|nr:hypothetical protein MBRA_27980 [Mycobacterium branderi]
MTDTPATGVRVAESNMRITISDRDARAAGAAAKMRTDVVDKEVGRWRDRSQGYG